MYGTAEEELRSVRAPRMFRAERYDPSESDESESDDEGENEDEEDMPSLVDGEVAAAARPAPQSGYPLQQPRKKKAARKSKQPRPTLQIPEPDPARLQAAEAALANRTPSPTIYQGCPARLARSPTTLLSPLHPSYTGKVTPTHPLVSLQMEI